MKQNLKFTSVLVAIGLLAGCASQTQKQVDQDLAKTPAVASPQELHEQTTAKINEDPRLTDEQRTKLKGLQAKFQEQYKTARDESLKLRSLLVDQLLAKSYKPREIAAIKGRIHAAEERRLEATFKAADEVSKILGHNEDHVQDDIQRRRTMENLLVSPSLM